jgi:DNA polymerase III epsilon subunit-like protein
MKDGKIVDRFVVYMNPGRSIAGAHAGKLDENGQPNAVDADGKPLTDEFLAKQLDQAEAMKQFLDWMGPDALVVAQNLAFDDEVIRRMADKHGLNYSPAGMMDTLPMARGIFKDVDAADKPKNISGKYVGQPGYSLEALANHFGIKLDNWHSADADSEATALVLEKLIDKGIELDGAKDMFDVDARNDEYIKKLDDYNRKLDLYENQLQEWAAAKAIQNAYNEFGITTHPIVKVEGFTEEEWKQDCLLRIQIIEQKDKLDELNEMKKEWEELLDKEDRKAMLLKKMAT